MAWVWPPHTSIDLPRPRDGARDRLGEALRCGGIAVFLAVLHVTAFAARPTSASSSSPISRRCLEYLHGFALVDQADGEADMDQHVVADLGLRHVGEIDLLDDAAEIDARRPHQRIVSRHAREDRPGIARHIRFSRFFHPAAHQPDRAPARRHWAERAHARRDEPPPHAMRRPCSPSAARSGSSRRSRPRSGSPTLTATSAIASASPS